MNLSVFGIQNTKQGVCVCKELPSCLLQVAQTAFKMLSPIYTYVFLFVRSIVAPPVMVWFSVTLMAATKLPYACRYALSCLLLALGSACSCLVLCLPCVHFNATLHARLDRDPTASCRSYGRPQVFLPCIPSACLFRVTWASLAVVTTAGSQIWSYKLWRGLKKQSAKQTFAANAKPKGA